MSQIAAQEHNQLCLSADLGSEMYVFRDGKQKRRTASLLDTVNERIRAQAAPLDVLLCAGELEAALCDAGFEWPQVAQLTDRAARSLVEGREQFSGEREIVLPSDAPAELTVGVPEGFAFYALHPLAFAKLAREVHSPGPAAVIGIRSIGATLSAVVAASLHASVERTTVRPQGDPYRRSTTFSRAQEHWIERQVARRATFYITDEGPGLSGSSLIGACEALEQAGVPRERITILCTADPHPESLLSENGAQRWRRYRSFRSAPYLPAALQGSTWYNADHWRARVFGHSPDAPHRWPAAWKQLESTKYLSSNWRELYRFVGYGHYGRPVIERYQALAAEQLGPGTEAVEGFAKFELLGGSAFTSPNWNEKTQHFIVRYLSQRPKLLRADEDVASRNCEAVREMVARNTHLLKGEAVRVRLALERPVYADNRMQPYKFMRSPLGMRKLDGAAHGDDHFFPGPCDIAWDIAGAIYEWRLSDTARESLLRDYVAATGDLFIRSRLRDWSIAYLAFRCGYCLMAANAERGSVECERFLRDARYYCEQLDVAIGNTRRRASERVPA